MEKLRWSSYLALIIGITLIMSIFKKNKSKQTININAYLFIFVIILTSAAYLALTFQHINQVSYFITLSYLYAISFYFYFRSILKVPFAGILSRYINFIPLFSFLCFLAVSSFIKSRDILQWLTLTFEIGALVINYVYLFVALKLIQRHRENTLDYKGYNRLSTLLLLLLAGLIFSTLSCCLNSLKPESSLSSLGYLGWLIITGTSYVLVYQFTFKFDISSTALADTPSTFSTGVSDVEITKEEIERLMLSSKPYIRHNFTIHSLAEMLNQKPTHLCWVIYKCYKKSFCDYINAYRIKHFIEVAPLEEHRHEHLSGIALEIGFNSKSTFHRAFKKELQMTPNDYFDESGLSL